MSLDVINEESGVLQCANSYFFLFYRNDGQDYNRLILQQTQVSHTCNCEDRAAVIHHVDNDYFRKASTVSLSLALWLEITTSVHHSVERGKCDILKTGRAEKYNDTTEIWQILATTSH